MTAEIAIMNKEAIALAADSAATMANEKTIPSVNKLFSLSKYHPVGIMIYQNAEFMSIPWETIIKIYREKLDKEVFDDLEDQVSHFIKFLNGNNPLFPNLEQEKYMIRTVKGYFNFIKQSITSEINSEVTQNNNITLQRINHIIKNVIRSHENIWKKAKKSESLPDNFKKIFLEKYSDLLDNIILEEFEELIKPIYFDKLKIFAVNLFSKFPEGIQNHNFSGIVIAGFGRKDIFPKLKSIHVEGIVINSLKYQEIKHIKITRTNNGAIVPFAQQEMVVRFMEGLDPNYKLTEEGYLTKVFDDYVETVVDIVEGYDKHGKRKLKNRLSKISSEIQEDYIKNLQQVRKEEFVDPILGVVAKLPKGDLASMAESLVNLTSFKRKWSLEKETVGGPIDVAVISKGDNFIWIKRKHYFEHQLNHQFFSNYYGDD